MLAAALRLARADLVRPPGPDRAHRVRDLRRRHRAGRHAGAARRARRAVRGRDGADQRRARRRLRRADRRRRGHAREPARAWRPQSRSRARTCSAPLAGASVDVGLEAMPAEIDRPHVTEGRLPASASEVLVERSFAREEGLQRRRQPARSGDTRVRDRRPGRDDPAGDLSALAAGHRLGARRDLEPAPRWASGSRTPRPSSAFVAAARQALAGRPAGGHRLA